MRILIFGSRTFRDFDKAEKDILPLIPKNTIPTFICGGAKGADQINERLHWKYESKLEYHLANWDDLEAENCKIAVGACGSYNKLAGFNRNQEMINSKPDLAICYWDGRSSGTKDMINRVKDNQIPLVLFGFH